MYVSPSFRNMGIGTYLLSHLTTLAVASFSATSIRCCLSLSQSVAAGLLEGGGFEPVEAFNEEEGAEVWLEKKLEVANAGVEGGGAR